MELRETTWTEVADSDCELAVVPVGSTEQHGPHAPLGTDVITAEAIADTACDRLERPVFRTPAISIGVAEEHRQFPGTMWVSPDTFRAYVRESVASLAHHGIDRVVLVNGHGGNVDALREVGARLTRDGTAYTVPFTWFDAIGEDASDMGHGGPVETSVLTFVAPDLVREERLEEAAADAATTWGEWVSHTNIAYNSDTFSDNGVVGDPRTASADRGERLCDTASEALVAVLEVVAERKY